jgi:hypothetical protein
MGRSCRTFREEPLVRFCVAWPKPSVRGYLKRVPETPPFECFVILEASNFTSGLGRRVVVIESYRTSTRLTVQSQCALCQAPARPRWIARVGALNREVPHTGPKERSGGFWL